MKMQFHHAGRQFFFITIAIERQGAPQGGLSRLVDERSRPALLPCDEIVKALLVAMHRCFPCATISDFVIMPDHVHFLLIVDYSQDPTFSPLWATHRLMDAAEILWAQELARGTDGGSAPEPPAVAAALAQAIAAARANLGQLIVGNHAVLPLQQKAPTPQGLQSNPTQQGFGGAVAMQSHPAGVRGLQAPVPSPQSHH